MWLSGVNLTYVMDPDWPMPVNAFQTCVLSGGTGVEHIS